MEFNDNVLKTISTTLRVDSGQLKEALIKPDAKIEVPVTKAFTEDEYNTLVDNIQKEKYEFGKQAGEEMLIKTMKNEFKEKLNIDTDGIKTYQELFEKALNATVSEKDEIINQLKEQQDKGSKAIEESFKLKLEKLESDKAGLQTLIQEINDKHNDELLKRDNELTKFKANHKLSVALDKMNWHVPTEVQKLGDEEIGRYVANEKRKASILFNSEYVINFDDDKVVIANKKGEVITDHLKNPESIDNVLKLFAKDFNLNLKKESSGQKVKGSKTYQAAYSQMTRSEFEKHVAEKGINQGANEYIKMLSDWKKAQV